MGKIKVLHVLGSLDRGGIETFLINLYRNIDKTKFHFDFLIHTKNIGMYGEEILKGGSLIYSVAARNEGIKINNKELDDFFKVNSSRYNFVHYHTSSMSYITPIVKAKKYGVKNIILHSHNTRAGGSKLHLLLHSVNKKIRGNVANIRFACSELAGNWMFNTCDKSNFTIIRNAIDIESFGFDGDYRQKLRKEFGFKDSNIVVGNVSRFHPQKNHLFLLEVFKELVKRNDEYRLVLVGDGNLRSIIEKKISELNLVDYVTLLGVRSDVNHIVNSFDLILFPSLYEGLGIVLVESQANGLPIFATNHTIPKEVKLLPSFHFLDLDIGPKKWANYIYNCNIERLKKSDVVSTLSSAGYGIKESTILLENIYIDLN